MPISVSSWVAPGARLASLLVLLYALLCSPPAVAQIYKWVDRQGVTHYGSEVPADAIGSAKTLAVPDPTPASSASSASWQDQERDFQARYDKQKAKQANDEKQAAARLAERQHACLTSRNQLEVLSRAQRVYTLDASGERVYMDDAQRAQRLATAEAAVANNCNN